MAIRLTASMIVKNELGRYLEPCIHSLMQFVDEVCVIDDGSTDGSYEFLEQTGVRVKSNEGPAFFEHEGKARQELLEWTMAGNPTHVLAIDADEFIAEGAHLRKIAAQRRAYVWGVPMLEVWDASEGELRIRQDGGWRAHPVPILYLVPDNRGADWKMLDRALACGREPLAVRKRAMRARPAETNVLHFGWTNRAERERRYQRYAIHDAGKFHRSTHLESIMWPDSQVQTTTIRWPRGLADVKDRILATAGGKT